ncbi:DNA excision repair protein ERCC-6 [Plectosphaerella plurivora]|uniref:DNA excision repair protein ERCC-6 n=1 Tax=Plectosphaerella plurivora TaxID=936078 RepID=A0A9P8V532_9PEZI|nr:DNA excision repair protein ERCC-6 [Plectosphaerella plurivora]
MDEPSPGDPYTWDVALLTQELCGGTRPWAPPNPQKRPDPVALSAALQEHELDGETFLSWDDVFGSHTDLFRDLGIVKAAHRMTLAKAIQHLKKRSPLYRQSKEQMLKEEQDDDQNSNDIELPDAKPIVESNVLPVQHQLNDQENPLPTTEVTDINSIPLFEAVPAQAPDSRDLPAVDSEPPAKKRRLAPQFVTSEVRDVGRAPIPTAADSVTITAAYGPTVYETDSKAVYLGKGALVLTDWVPGSSLRSSYSQDSGTQSKEFSWSRNNKSIAPGRKLQVNRGMLRLFQANSRAEKMLQDNIAPFVDHSPSPEPSADDKILPCFGDSDDDNGYDSDTIMEMEQEAAEKHVVPGMLDMSQVQAVLDDVIESFIQRWNDDKLERHQRKAHPEWKKAQLQGRNREIARSVKRVSELDARIKSLVAEIHSQDWPNETQLRRQARCMEASVEDRQSELWRIDMLKGREPPKIPAASRPRPKRRSIRPDLSDDDGEFITSESDQSDVEVPAPFSHLRLSTRRPSSSPPLPPLSPDEPRPSSVPDDVVDLTMMDEDDTDSDSSDSSRSTTSVINLITPDHSRVITEMPSEQWELTPEQLSIPFHRHEEIGNIHAGAWAAAQDPLRLTISYLAKLKGGSKFKILQQIRSKDPDELWREYILLACNPVKTTEGGQPARMEMAVKFARIFWLFVTCSLPMPAITRVLSTRLREEMPQKREQFQDFIDFMKQHVCPHMIPDGRSTGTPPILTTPVKRAEDSKPLPTADDDTVMNGDGSDSSDHVDSSDQAEHGDASLSSAKKKKKVRPVVRDAAAERLRLDENDRVEAEKLRSARLQKRLANSATITEEQARLIINLSKEDDDSPLISISTKSDPGRPSIADRIKDHQIDGVRFMWNHLVANQGCLLAHTMGLGKTMQVITVLVAICETGLSKESPINSQVPEDLRRMPRILILCPAGLVDNWIEEIAIWAPTDVFTPGVNISYLGPATLAPERPEVIRTWGERGGIFVIGYDLFRNVYEQSQELGDYLATTPDIVIADEAHRLKNRETKLANMAATFRTSRRVALSGTPLANHIGEFHSAIDWIAPNFLGPFKEFKAVYVDPIETGLYSESSGSEFRRAKKMLAALEKTVAPKTHRLTMACLKEQLPAKMEFLITMPMTPLQVRLYKLYHASLSAPSDGRNVATQVFAVTANMALLCNHPKCFQQRLIAERQNRDTASEECDRTLSPSFVTEALKIFAREKDVGSMHHSWKVQHLVKILDECRKTKEKTLVFSQSIPTLDYLENLLRQQGRSLSKLTGSTDSKVRQTMVRDFNLSETQEVFLISTNAGGIGLNITGASRVIIFDIKFNPVSELQAIGRAYRMGQRRNVFVYRFLAAGTYEKHLTNKAVFKTQLASRVVDKENPKRSSTKFSDTLRPLDEDVPFDDLSEFQGRDHILNAMLAAQNKSINAIITTDTFDEEDPDDTALSVEERKEVDSMIEMNRVRHTDPARFALLEQQLSMSRAAEQHKLLSEAAKRHPSQSVPKPVSAPFRPYAPPAQAMGTQSIASLPPTGPQIPPIRAPLPASQKPLVWKHSTLSASPVPSSSAPPVAPSSAPWVPSPGVSHVPLPSVPREPVPSRIQPAAYVGRPQNDPRVAPPAVPRGVVPVTPQPTPVSAPQRATHVAPQPPRLFPQVAAHSASPMASRGTPQAGPQPVLGAGPQPVLGAGIRTVSQTAPPITPQSVPRTSSTPVRTPTTVPAKPQTGATASGGVPSQRGTSVKNPTQQSDAPATGTPLTRDGWLDRQISLFESKLFAGYAMDKSSKGEKPPPPETIFKDAAAITKQVRAIQTERNRGFLPDKSRWNELADKADIPLFCSDVLEGRVTVQDLVDSDVTSYIWGWEKLTNKPKPVPAAALPATASPAQEPKGKEVNSNDPNHLRKALSRTDPPASSNGGPPNSQADEDMKAMQRIADRRKSKNKARLPPWANNAVEDAK